jgi:hypothetical protein
MVTMIVLGLVAQKIDIDAKSKVYNGLKLLSSLGHLGSFIWAFRYDHLPQAVSDRFIADLGGSPQAVDASNYLRGELGASVLVLGLGFVVGLFGQSVRQGLAVTCLVILLVVLLSTGIIT